MPNAPLYSLIIPVYKNEGTIEDLCERVEAIAAQLSGHLEAVFVVDGSPDRSYTLLLERLPSLSCPTQLVALSRNFGSFSAIRKGLEMGRGQYFAVMAADLQEPAELTARFFQELKAGSADIAIGTRADRSGDPLWSALSSQMFWALYRLAVQKDIPPGGVDVFGCTRNVRDTLLVLEESHTSLVGLLFWIGYRRVLIPYQRQSRTDGKKSGWSFRRKFDYLLDSCFSFSDLPVKFLMLTGFIGAIVATLVSIVVLIAFVLGVVNVPGYVPLMLTLVFSFATLILSLGIVGNYAWRTYENTKRRPPYLELSRMAFNGRTKSKGRRP